MLLLRNGHARSTAPDGRGHHGGNSYVTMGRCARGEPLESRRLASTMHRLVQLAVTGLLVDVLTEAWSDTLFGDGWIKTVRVAFTYWFLV